MISKDLLIHSVTLKKAAGIDRDRNKTYADYTIENVRIVPIVANAKASEGETPSDSATLYIDKAQSRIANAEIELAKVQIDTGDKVVWSNREFSVTSITPCHASELHHWEVGLK